MKSQWTTIHQLRGGHSPKKSNEYSYQKKWSIFYPEPVVPLPFPNFKKPEIVCIIFCCTWNAKCPIFLGNFINFTPKNQQLLP